MPGTLDLPAVAAEALVGVDPAPGDARDDGPLAQGAAAARIIATLVGVQLAGRRCGRLARCRLVGGGASTVASSFWLSWAEMVTVSGMPLASMTT